MGRNEAVDVVPDVFHGGVKSSSGALRATLSIGECCPFFVRAMPSVLARRC